MVMWAIPAILAAAGVARGIAASQQADPNAGAYGAMAQRADEAESQAGRDIRGAMQANIRNQTANAIIGTRQSANAAGRGSTPTTQADVASLASQGAGRENQAMMYGDQRREGLLDRAANLRMQRGQMRGDFKQRKSQAVWDSVLGGVTSGVSAFGALNEGGNDTNWNDWRSQFLGGE